MFLPERRQLVLRAALSKFDFSIDRTSCRHIRCDLEFLFDMMRCLSDPTRSLVVRENLLPVFSSRSAGAPGSQGGESLAGRSVRATRAIRGATDDPTLVLQIWTAVLIVLAGFYGGCGGGGVVNPSTNSPSAPSLTATPSKVDFGKVSVGSKSTQTLTLTNTGTGTLTVSQATVTGPAFAVGSPSLPLSLTGSQSVILSLTFAPSLAGAAAGTLSIASSASSATASIPLSGMGISSQLKASSASIDFGNVTVGGSNSQTVTLSNTGTSSLTLLQASVNGAGFTINGLTLPWTLTAGQTATFNASFAPTATGSVSGSLSVVSNATNSPAVVSLSGTGVGLLLSASPSSLSFGNVTVGGSNSQTVTLMNKGSGSVTVPQVTASGTGYSLSGLSLPFTLSTGQSTTFNVAFAPKVSGIASGSIIVIGDATNSRTTISLLGTGVTLLIGISPASTDFGSVVLGSKAVLPIVLANAGTDSVTISQATVTGSGFSVGGPSLPLTLAVGEQIGGFSATFAPTAAGAVTGNVTFVSNATNSPSNEPLAGSGVHAVHLSWTDSTSLPAGYNVYQATLTGGPYTKLNSSLVSGTTYTDMTVEAGRAYYYVARAVDASNNESADSNEVNVVVPSP